MTTSLNAEWLDAIHNVIIGGDYVCPRGRATLEIEHFRVSFSTSQPVLTIPERNLNYRFMAAEAYWILSGDDQVETIAPYNKNISQFSDDGERFFGAYGPRFIDQLDGVVNKLLGDIDTRQAALTLWRQNPKPSKDIPCTIAVVFSARGGLLNTHVFMRSSDLWLGLPYDAFNFSMMGCLVAGCFNHQRQDNQILLGTTSITAVSSHLYTDNDNVNMAQKIIDNYHGPISDQPRIPMLLYSCNGEKMSSPPQRLMTCLDAIRNGDRSQRWWL